MQWELDIAVQGGSWPFKYEITTGPAGMTIGETLTPLGDVQVVGDSYGKLVWPNPTGTSESVTVKVTDQDGNTATWSTTLTIGTARHVFVDDIGTGTGTGTIADPYTDWDDFWVSNTDNGNLNKIVVFRAGTYTPSDGASGESIVNPTYKPRSYINYPGESVTFTMSTARIQSIAPDFYIRGIDLDGYKTTAANWRCIFLNGQFDRQSIQRCTFDNMEEGTVGTDNPACIYANGISTKRQNITVSRCTQKADCNISLITTFDCQHVVVEHNIGDGTNITSHNGDFFIQIKDDSSDVSVRRNSAINCNGSGRGGIWFNNQKSTPSSGVANNQEMCWNVIEDNNTGVIGAINSNTSSESTNTYIFRNTIINNTNNASQTFWFSTNGIGDDPVAIYNCFSNTSGILGAVYDDALDAMSNQAIALTSFDADGNLTGTARTSNLGIRGYEVA